MSSILEITQGSIDQGILWGIMAIGVFITFRLLDFPDLTVDGSFALGGATCAKLIVLGINPIIALIISIISGLLAGLVTALLNTKFKIPSILAGILAQLALFSINLRVMGRANTPLLRNKTMFDNFSEILSKIGINIDTKYTSLLLGIMFAIFVIVFLYWFFGTEIGCAIRATGHNANMVRAQGQSTDTTTIIALMISNGLVAMSGALVGMSQGYADINMGTGAIVIGLASIVIGEVIFSRTKSFGAALTGIVIGSIIYRIIIAAVIQVGLNPDDLKMFTAIIVTFALALPEIRRYLISKRQGM